jgi:FMN phosphatase YigB (HAD superfamily)
MPTDPVIAPVRPVGAPPARSVLVSFDIDGTLEDGDPPGPLEMALVRRAQALGYVIGSSSDRTRREQTRMWERRGIAADFVGHKQNLDRVAALFPAERMVHIGDTFVDAHYARLHGFEFFFAAEVPAAGTAGWIL